MRKLPRREVIERQLESIRDTFESIDDAAMEKLRGGQMQARYGIAPRTEPEEPTGPVDGGTQTPMPTLSPLPETKVGDPFSMSTFD